MKMLTKTAIVAAGLFLGAGVGLVGSAALGLGTSAQASAAELSVSTAAPTPTYARNAAGQTYGSAAHAATIEQMPELISVWVDKDTVGYVPREVLFPANPSAEKALASNGLRVNNTVRAYKSDGKTIIGDVFLGETVAAPPAK